MLREALQKLNKQVLSYKQSLWVCDPEHHKEPHLSYGSYNLVLWVQTKGTKKIVIWKNLDNYNFTKLSGIQWQKHERPIAQDYTKELSRMVNGLPIQIGIRELVDTKILIMCDDKLVLDHIESHNSIKFLGKISSLTLRYFRSASRRNDL